MTKLLLLSLAVSVGAAYAQPACIPDQPYFIQPNRTGTVRSFNQNVTLNQVSPTVGGEGACNTSPRSFKEITAYVNFTNVNCPTLSGSGSVFFNGSPHQIDSFISANTPHGTQVINAEFYADCRCTPQTGELWYNYQNTFTCY
jgi:hypothetical protein